MVLSHSNYLYGLNKPTELTILGNSVIENQKIYSREEDGQTLWYATVRNEYNLSEFLSVKVRLLNSVSQEHDELIAELIEEGD